jgi:hypothetical protein
MNPTRARKRIRELARAGAWELTAYAVGRMIERMVDHADVYKVLVAAPACFASPPNRWRLEGPDGRGDPLTVIVEIRDSALVVTLFRGDE